jgi:Zn-finger nucleic acid-binding protein
MKIECPDCDQILKSVFYEGVQVQVCFGCKGYFLDKDKLIQIEENREI